MKDYEITGNKQLAINLCSSIIAFAINLLVSFFLSPYIVKTLGVEANGFVSLANTFITYATLITIALNSMAGRFITVSIYKNDYTLANKYYNAVFVGNVIIITILLIPAIVCMYKLEYLINIPKDLIFDVKILFLLLFVNFFIGTVIPNWGVATFVANKIHLQSLRAMESNLLRVTIILTLFIIFTPHVYYIGIATLASSIYNIFFNWIYKKKLLPEIGINLKYFETKKIIELVSSGIWNTISQAGQMLLSGLDLLVTNLFIGTTQMGVLALAKSIPSIIVSLAGTLTGVFSPSLTIEYAKGNKEAIEKSLKQGMKLTSIILTIPLTILIIYGKEFYSLWVPTEDASVLQILSILTCFGMIFTSGIQCLFNIFTVVNKIKLNSILLLISGMVSTILVFILLKTTNLGIFAVAGVSSFVNLIRNIIYTVPFSAKYLNLKWNTFFPEIFTSIITVIITGIFGYLIKQIIYINSWWTLIIATGMMSIIGMLINILVILNKEERNYLFKIIENKLRFFRKIKEL